MLASCGVDAMPQILTRIIRYTSLPLSVRSQFVTTPLPPLPPAPLRARNFWHRQGTYFDQSGLEYPDDRGLPAGRPVNPTWEGNRGDLSPVTVELQMLPHQEEGSGDGFPSDWVGELRLVAERVTDLKGRSYPALLIRKRAEQRHRLPRSDLRRGREMRADTKADVTLPYDPRELRTRRGGHL
ncbi:hypothetical protein FJT64_011185 [Amphibalanus amphitrite]|uniref:Uncharacterized protein n=1 Tax=Amphibalanus amphitrite TaxID=1232801 RepID=A0A6A4VA61_AMPAM|nr:hypothetical protein FJT64_011185 [Amphibalanus amphitrite]